MQKKKSLTREGLLGPKWDVGGLQFVESHLNIIWRYVSEWKTQTERLGGFYSAKELFHDRANKTWNFTYLMKQTINLRLQLRYSTPALHTRSPRYNHRHLQFKVLMSKAVSGERSFIVHDLGEPLETVSSRLDQLSP